MHKIKHRITREITIAWLLPLGLLLSEYIFWQQQKISAEFVWFIFLLPLFFGYGVVSYAISIKKLWRWEIAGTFKGVPPHIGFIYTAYFNLFLIVASYFIIKLPATILNLVLFICCLTSAAIIFGLVHDTLGIKFGIIKIRNTTLPKNQTPYATVYSYVFNFFGGLGFIYALLSASAYYLFVSLNQTGFFWPLIILGTFFLCVPYVYIFSKTNKYRAD